MSKQTDLAYQYIKDKIFDGTYKPSQKLIESQLAEMIGVSRNTIKKALLKLEQENLVDIEDNKGATIKSYSPAEIIHSLEILDALERLVFLSAVENVTEQELSKMEQIVKKMEEIISQNKYEEYANLIMEFREIIYTLADNKQAVGLIHSIRNPLKRYQLRSMLFPGTKESSVKEHRKMVELMKKRDSVGLEKAVQEDLRIVRETFLQNYQFLF